VLVFRSLALASKEHSSSSRISHLLHIIPQHLISALSKCEFHLLSFSWDNPKTCVLFSHRHNISLLLLCLFLFLWEKGLYHHHVFLKNFLLSQSDYVVSPPHPWASVLYPRQLLCLYSSFKLCFVDSAS
jgi:hypothetical protein